MCRPGERDIVRRSIQPGAESRVVPMTTTRRQPQRTIGQIPSEPRITVVTPSYNHGRYIERAICSVLDQGYPNLEYIIVDGESFDETRDVLGFYEQRVNAIIREFDHGPAEAINKALRRSTGDLVMVLHADDVLLPGALFEVARRMEQDKSMAWAVGDCMRIDDGDRMLGDLRASTPGNAAKFLMHDDGVLPTSSIVWRREVFEHFGLFDPRLQYGHHYDMACRLIMEDVSPHALGFAIAARREHAEQRTAIHAVEYGVELLEIAERHALHLPVGERFALSMNLEKRRRILAAAQAELAASQRKAA